MAFLLPQRNVKLTRISPGHTNTRFKWDSIKKEVQARFNSLQKLSHLSPESHELP